MMFGMTSFGYMTVFAIGGFLRFGLAFSMIRVIRTWQKEENLLESEKAA